MKLTDKEVSGTSFTDVTIATTIENLNKIFEHPTYENNTGYDKVNFEYECETNDGQTVFTIYDWKQYRQISEYEVINFHIGCFKHEDALKAKEELENILNK